jgi:hypothetical protein
LLVDAPTDFAFDDPPIGCRTERRRSSRLRASGRDDPPDVTVAFVHNQEELDALVRALADSSQDLTPLWLCWPRRAGGHESDLTDDRVRAGGLSLGLVDTKVAAVNADWSGLRFSRRRA